MRLGMIVKFINEEDINQIKRARDLGFESCQLDGWNPDLWTDEMAEKLKAELVKYNVSISAFWCGWTGPAVWNIEFGPETVGLVPEVYRHKRIEEFKRGSDFAKKLGVKQFVTHVGFIPEEPHRREYKSLIIAIREVALHCKQNGQYFMFETGEETPLTLLRTIEDVGTDNLGVNLDPANLICYGKGNPIDALELLGKYVREVHAKDFCHPVNGQSVGVEVPIGEGNVNFPAFFKKLKEIGYDGTITIEREITGEQQTKDVLAAKDYLTELWNNV